MRIVQVMVLVLALVSLVGCGGPLPPTAGAIPAATATISMAAQTAPSTPAVTPSPTSSPCPIPNATLPIPHPDAPLAFPEGYIALIGDYLSAGGGAIEALLLENEWIPPRGKATLLADLTGDGLEERAVAFIDPTSTTFPPRAAMALYWCREGAMEPFATREEEPGFTLGLVGAADLTGEGREDLVFFEETCGASTCWDMPHVWQWTGGEFIELMPPHVEYPSAEITLEGAQIVIVSYGFGSVGAGPQRTLTETWQWVGDALTITERSQSPPNYLIDLFTDGDAALRAKDYDAAFAAFHRLIYDSDDLATASWSYDAAEERAWFVALAHWRLLTLDMFLGNYPAANREYTWLTAIPPDDPTYPVGQVARRFWEAYQQSGNVAYACQAVNSEEALIGPLLAFLNDFGYAIPAYGAQEVCPFLNPAEGAGGTQ